MNKAIQDKYHLKRDEGVCDIGATRRIGIELKLDSDKKSKANRRVGQIHDYKTDYPIGIVVFLSEIPSIMLFKRLQTHNTSCGLLIKNSAKPDDSIFSRISRG
ncbi:MAG: hypothetical protein ABSE07_03550 [Methanoregula sp.]|jgi:hypothetical protein